MTRVRVTQQQQQIGYDGQQQQQKAATNTYQTPPYQQQQAINKPYMSVTNTVTTAAVSYPGHIPMIHPLLQYQSITTTKRNSSNNRWLYNKVTVHAPTTSGVHQEATSASIESKLVKDQPRQPAADLLL